MRARRIVPPGIAHLRFVLSACVASLVLALGARRAGACSDVERYEHLVGVAPDGRFVHTTSSPENGCGCLVESYTLHASDGAILFRYFREEGAWDAVRPAPPDLAALAPQSGEVLAALEARARKLLSLTPPTLSRVPVVPAAPDEQRRACIAFEAYARGSGTVIAELEDHYLCPAARRGALYHHPASPLSFLGYVAGVRRQPDDGLVCASYYEGYTWFPRGRVRSATLARVAERAGASGRALRAAELLAEAVATDPTNRPAELALVAWLDRGGVAWPEVARRLALVAPPAQRCEALEVPSDTYERFYALGASLGERPGFDATAFDAWTASFAPARPDCAFR
ncbi:MAG: hypothetical protein HY908_29445 [Myxococcales bacterium]|nr:hypothetical protein [Myxococcales bacterium]